jgi:hypothetical protein
MAIAVFVLCLSRPSSAQDLKVIDTILKVEPSEGAKAYLTFCSNNDGLIGHAFVALSLDDPKSQSCRLIVSVHQNQSFHLRRGLDFGCSVR